MPACRFLLVLLLLFPFTVFGQYENLLHKTFAERYIAIDTMFYAGKIMRADSVVIFRELDKLEALAKASRDEALVLETQLIRHFYDLIGHQQNHPRGEARLKKLLATADDKGITHLQIRVRDKLAHYFFHVVHKYGPAFENYLAYYNLLKDIPSDVLPEKQELIANIGSAYFLFGDNQNARRYFDEAQKAKPSYKPRFPINLQNTLGLIYRTEKDYKMAEHHFRKAYAMAETKHDSTWMGIAAGNIGISYAQQKRFTEALPLLEFDVRQSVLAHEMDNALGSLIMIMKIKEKEGDWAEVQERLKLARKLLPFTGNPQVHQKEIFTLLARHHAASGHFEHAYRYADSSAAVRDTLSHRRNATLLRRIEQKAEIEQHQDEVQRLEADRKFQKLLVYSLLIGILLLIIIAALILNRQRIVFRQRQQMLRIEKEAIANELELAATKLNDFTHSIREKNKLLEQFTAEILQVQATNGSKDSVEQQVALKKLQQATILTDDQWDEFRELFETVHNGYLQRLKTKVPGLSPAETRFMVLNKLELSNKEMAAMLGVTPEAIRQIRHRLRKKLETNHNASLEDLSSTI